MAKLGTSPTSPTEKEPIYTAEPLPEKAKGNGSTESGVSVRLRLNTRLAEFSLRSNRISRQALMISFLFLGIFFRAKAVFL